MDSLFLWENFQAYCESLGVRGAGIIVQTNGELTKVPTP